jgi:hypothetical protein
VPERRRQQDRGRGQPAVKRRGSQPGPFPSERPRSLYASARHGRRHRGSRRIRSG